MAAGMAATGMMTVVTRAWTVRGGMPTGIGRLTREMAKVRATIALMEMTRGMEEGVEERVMMVDTADYVVVMGRMIGKRKDGMRKMMMLREDMT